MNETIQMQMQFEMFTVNTKVQLLSIAKDLYLGKPTDFDSFLEAYTQLAEQVFGKQPKQDPEAKTPPQV